MRAFIVVSCLLAVASAGLLHAPLAYNSGAAVFDQNGYKIDEVGPYNTLPYASPLAAPFINARTIAAPLGAHIAAPLAAPLAAHIAAPVAYAADYKWAGPQHIPVIGPNGVPLDTPEVAAGKVANAVAHTEAKVRNGDVGVVAPIAPLATPVIAARSYAAPLAVATYASQHIPVIGSNGVPLDTPEVAHAKAVHYEAHIDAKLRNGHLPLIHYRKRRGLIASAPLAYAHAYPQHIPVIGPNGVPLETPEVVAAKISHAAAHVEAKALNGELSVVAPYAAPIVAHQALAAPIAHPVAYAAHGLYHGPQHLPIIGANGVPLDTPEVAAGKAANAVAHAEAHARNGDYAIAAPIAHLASPVIAARSYAAPLAVAAPYYAAPHHVPVIGANGVPLDTPEVAAGKVANAVAHAEAKARNGDLIYHY